MSRTSLKKRNPVAYARLREWYLKKMELGSYKTIAFELGVSDHAVKKICENIRKEKLAEKQSFAEIRPSPRTYRSQLNER